MRPLFVALLVSCGSPTGQPPPPAPAPEIPPVSSTHADEIAALAKDLDDTTSLADLREAVVAIHALDRYKRATAHARDYRPLEPAQIDLAIAKRHSLAQRFASSARLLRTGRIAEAIEPLAHDLTDAFASSLGSLSSDIVDELAFVRDHVCTPRQPCADLAKISTAFDVEHELAPRLRRTLDRTADDILATAHLDTHTTVVLQRAANRGPSFGAACGPEDLCGEDNICERATHTCEARCAIGAMQPCPGNRACKAVAGITELVCR